MIDVILVLIFGLAALYVSVWILILLPARMAEARGRSVVFWVLVSLCFSPFLAVFLLWFLGNHPDFEDCENTD